MTKNKSEGRMSIWSSLYFVESPIAEYLETLVQLCRNMDKNKKKGNKTKNDQRSQHIQNRLAKHHKMFNLMKPILTEKNNLL